MVKLHLEAEAEALLKHYAAQAGQTESEFARRAVLEALEDHEDYEAGVTALKESEGQPTFSLEEVVRSLALERKIHDQSAKTTGEPGCHNAKTNPKLRQRKASRVA
jgi:predicted DNA-binding protein